METVMRAFQFGAVFAASAVLPVGVSAQETIEPSIESCAIANQTLTQRLECDAAKRAKRAEERREEARLAREELEQAYNGPNTFRCTNRGNVVLEELADYVNFDSQSERYSINYNGNVKYYTAAGGDVCELISN